ncbi:MAG: DUF423 domain-containing protein [Betaproteobacteria bacterium]|nr:DUF423 domain-containing protein [Betaproteobacteria bacterium]
MKNNPLLFAAGSLLALLGVAFGALGAHALKPYLNSEMLVVYQTGVQYHLIHALGIVAIAAYAQQQPALPAFIRAGWLMALGIVLFSGSLYLLAFTGIRSLGAVTPLGGLCFIAAWGWVAVTALRAAREP